MDERDKLIRDLAELIQSLGVPVSIGLLKGKSASAWTEVHRELIGFGWSTAEQYETALRDKLGLETVSGG